MKCNHCDYTHFRSDALTNHMKSHNRESLFECDQCIFVTHTRVLLRRHFKSTHIEKVADIGGKKEKSVNLKDYI